MHFPMVIRQIARVQILVLSLMFNAGYFIYTTLNLVETFCTLKHQILKFIFSELGGERQKES